MTPLVSGRSQEVLALGLGCITAGCVMLYQATSNVLKMGKESFPETSENVHLDVAV